VSLIKGDSRRKNIFDALVAIDDQIRPALKTKKYVFVKINGVEAAGGCSVPPNPMPGRHFRLPRPRSKVPCCRRFRGSSGPADRQ